MVDAQQFFGLNPDIFHKDAVDVRSPFILPVGSDKIEGDIGIGDGKV